MHLGYVILSQNNTELRGYCRNYAYVCKHIAYSNPIGYF